jgi:serine protease Do
LPRDKDHDLALLRIDATGLPIVPLADSKDTTVGNWVACAGPGGQPVAFGVVSVAARKVDAKGPASANPRAGYLGIALDASPDGLRVIQVVPKSAADKADLKVDDIILTLEGKPVSREPQEFIAKMQKTRPGQTVKLRIKRTDVELDIQAKLDKRPFNRGDFQNALGSELSNRRSGYPVILQFDAVLKPADCGGPLVNLDGQVIGLTISRAGRTETYAIPAETIRPLLAALKSGKLPPPKEELRPAKQQEQPRKASPKASKLDKDELRSLDDLLALMHRRLALMPAVARAKWNAGLPIADPVREKEFLDAVAAQARGLGADAARARRFFRDAA